MTAPIEIIVRGLVRRGSQVLLCRNDQGLYYYLPGGHIEFGESAVQSLQREFKEECGVDVAVGPLAMACEVVFRQNAKWRHELNLVFHVQLPSSNVASLEPGISFHWIELASVPSADVRPDAVKAWLMSGGRHDPEWVSQVPSEGPLSECR